LRAGRFAVFVPALLKPRPALVRAKLWALWHGVAVPELPAPALVSMPCPEGWPEGFAAAIGWVVAGPVLLRLDVAERVAAELAWSSRGRPVPVPAGLASRLSLRADRLPPVLHALGLRLFPAEALPPGQFGPPAPAMMATARPRKAAPPPLPAPPRPHGPFAALASLRL
jgi:ATP-dependent RNA helicase SUPV3L1/SUV3